MPMHQDPLLVAPLYGIYRIHARAVMHVGIANPWWRGKRSLHSRRRRSPQFLRMWQEANCVKMGTHTAFVTCILGHCLLHMPCVVLYHCFLILPMVLILHQTSRVLLLCVRISCSLYSIHKYVSYAVYLICLFYVHEMCTPYRRQAIIWTYNGQFTDANMRHSASMTRFSKTSIEIHWQFSLTSLTLWELHWKLAKTTL